MFLGGHVAREREDWMDLSLGYAKLLTSLNYSLTQGNADLKEYRCMMNTLVHLVL